MSCRRLPTAAVAPDVHPGFRRRRGFTLIEVLATLMLLAIVFPVMMQGITVAGSVADAARRRTEATGLAQSKLAEIVANGQWQQGNLSGDFGSDWPAYRWEATVQPWTLDNTSQSLQQIDLRVVWTARGRENSVTVTTLAYVRGQSTS
ncbi:MAG: prepilin-type N-terminal cleavage/methylation domain-containing protein [Tepidisphaeraceae bacterium]